MTPPVVDSQWGKVTRVWRHSQRCSRTVCLVKKTRRNQQEQYLAATKTRLVLQSAAVSAV